MGLCAVDKAFFGFAFSRPSSGRREGCCGVGDFDAIDFEGCAEDFDAIGFEGCAEDFDATDVEGCAEDFAGGALMMPINGFDSTEDTVTTRDVGFLVVTLRSFWACTLPVHDFRVSPVNVLPVWPMGYFLVPV